MRGDNAVWAKCRGCEHVWPVAYLPMEMEAAARQILAASCPQCGRDAAASAVMASKADIPGARVSVSGIPITRRTK